MTTTHINRSLRQAAFILPLATVSKNAFAQAAGGNTLGGMATRIAQDSLQWGSLFTVVAYIVGAVLVLSGLYALYAHSRNPNGQWKAHHGAMGILLGGALFAWNIIGGYGAQTVTGHAATATGANSQVLQIQ